jgi:hypothetical protein
MPIIEFSSHEEFMPIPKPSKNYIPEWYSKASAFFGGKPKLDRTGMNIAMKSCVPFMDTMLTGYTAELWTDLQITQGPNGPEILWPGAAIGTSTMDTEQVHNPLSVRGPEASYPMPAPAGYHDTHFVWHNPYLIKTPPGYSVLITQPLNQYNLPFMTLSGVVDCDKDLMPTGRLPFFVREGFEGVVPRGTPIYQIIPFKREKWDSVENTQLRKDNLRRGYNVASVMYGWYKKNLWSKKEYN